MVIAERLFERLQSAGCAISVVDGRLVADAPVGAITPELDAEVARYRDLLIDVALARKAHSLAGLGQAIAARRRALIDDAGSPRCSECGRLAIRDGRHLCVACDREPRI